MGSKEEIDFFSLHFKERLKGLELIFLKFKFVAYTPKELMLPNGLHSI